MITSGGVDTDDPRDSALRVAAHARRRTAIGIDAFDLLRDLRASSHELVCGPAKANGTVEAATMTQPMRTMRREPYLSMLLPATVRDKRVPMPCGTSRIPAVSAVAPRTSW